MGRLALWNWARSLRSRSYAQTGKLPIDKIYVPVKRRKALKSDVVQEIAESIQEIGQQAPILVRPDGDRFVLVEGFHRLEACKALGEKTIIGLLVSADLAHQKALLPQNPEAEAEHEKMERLKKLRLEKEAAEKLAAASRAIMEAESARLPRKRPAKYMRNTLSATPNHLGRGISGSTPTTLSEWLTQQERDGGRY
jgi:ParB-like nuclease domain